MSDDVYSKGDYIIISSGEYSSYGVSAIARALKDFTAEDIKPFTEYQPWDSARRHGHISTEKLAAAGFIEELPDFREIWTGGC